jgi:NAD(P)-dependent dehydrogenase (short-subunit alcohol dehydrogenase family)
MNISGSVVFVTGASRGLGLAFAKLAVAQGAAKVYAGMRNPEGFDVPGIIAVKLDVTDEATIKAAAAQCADTTLLVNNAGIAKVMEGALAENMIELSKELIDTNVYGLVRVSAAFAPILKRNGGGAIINVLSNITWFNAPMLAAYGVSKAAAWGFTNALRVQLRADQTQVLALHVGFIDTDLVKDFDVEKTSPQDVAARTYAALEAGDEEIMADEGTRQIKASLSTNDAFYLNPVGF